MCTYLWTDLCTDSWTDSPDSCHLARVYILMTMCTAMTMIVMCSLSCCHTFALQFLVCLDNLLLVTSQKVHSMLQTRGHKAKAFLYVIKSKYRTECSKIFLNPAVFNTSCLYIGLQYTLKQEPRITGILVKVTILYRVRYLTIPCIYYRFLQSLFTYF